MYAFRYIERALLCFICTICNKLYLKPEAVFMSACPCMGRWYHVSGGTCRTAAKSNTGWSCILRKYILSFDAFAFAHWKGKSSRRERGTCYYSLIALSWPYRQQKPCMTMSRNVRETKFLSDNISCDNLISVFKMSPFSLKSLSLSLAFLCRL